MLVELDYSIVLTTTNVAVALCHYNYYGGTCLQALALIELHKAPKSLYKNQVYLLPKKMGKSDDHCIE